MEPKYFFEALCNPQTWLYTIVMTIGVIGLAKSWMQYKKKHAEKAATTEASESN